LTGIALLRVISLSQERSASPIMVKYSDAGVDIDKANAFVENIKPLIQSTSRKGVMGGVGGFGGLFSLDSRKYRQPVLVASTDGVGTKLMIAGMMDRHDTIGIDLVAMSVNDLIVQGAEPLFFLDYIATGKLDVHRNVEIVRGIAQGCREAGCALIGGENAEMPGLYRDKDYDLAGFCVGVVESDRIIDGSEVSVGDSIIGLASNGIHSNGLSLARKVFFDTLNLSVTDSVDTLDATIGDELLRPTRIYVKTILHIIRDFSVKGIAHITGGGFSENIPRTIPKRCKAVIDDGSWPVSPLFRVLEERGSIDRQEMFRTFNMGIGMVIIVDARDAKEVMQRLDSLGEEAYVIGSIAPRSKKESAVTVE